MTDSNYDNTGTSLHEGEEQEGVPLPPRIRPPEIFVIASADAPSMYARNMLAIQCVPPAQDQPLLLRISPPTPAPARISGEAFSGFLLGAGEPGRGGEIRRPHPESIFGEG